MAQIKVCIYYVVFTAQFCLVLIVKQVSLLLFSNGYCVFDVCVATLSVYP